MEQITGAPNVVLIDPLRDERWDRFVENHPFGWIVHLSGWKEMLERSFPHMKGYYLIVEDEKNGRIVAGLPIFQVKSWFTGKRLVSIPFATLCDPLISDDKSTAALLEGAIELSHQLDADWIEIRALHANMPTEHPRFGRVSFFHHHYLTLDKPLEELKTSFHAKAVRYEINKANKSGLHRVIADSKEELKLFYRLYVKTRTRLGLPPHPYCLFESLWDVFVPQGALKLTLAILNQDVAAAQIFFKYKDRVSMEFEAWDFRFRNISPNHFLIWEEIKDSYQEGYLTFDFGRTSIRNVSLMDFKRRWGSSVVDLPKFIYPLERSAQFSENDSNLTYRIARVVFQHSPDLISKTLGKLLYKHLG